MNDLNIKLLLQMVIVFSKGDKYKRPYEKKLLFYASKTRVKGSVMTISFKGDEIKIDSIIMEIILSSTIVHYIS